MFRALVLSIALTVAAGPSAAILCRAWCNPPVAPADGCHHAASTASISVAANDTCDDRALSAAAFVREDVRRGVPSPDGPYALLVPRHHLADTTSDDSRRQNSWPESALEKRPLATNLRI